MMEIVSFVWSFIATSTGLIGLGLVVGFSPILYAAQASLIAKPKTAKISMFLLMAGVLVGTIGLGILFLFFQPNVLARFVSSTLHIILVSSLFYLVAGVGFIIAGLHFFRRATQRTKKPKKEAASPTGRWAIFSLGAGKTMLSASGAASIFIASGIIIQSPFTLLLDLVLAVIFLASVIAPFIAIYAIWRYSPKALDSLISQAQKVIRKVHIERLFGYIFIALGALIIALTLATQLI